MCYSLCACFFKVSAVEALHSGGIYLWKGLFVLFYRVHDTLHPFDMSVCRFVFTSSVIDRSELHHLPHSSSSGRWIDSSGRLFHFSLCVVIEASYAFVSSTLLHRCTILVFRSESKCFDAVWMFFEASWKVLSIRHTTVARFCLGFVLTESLSYTSWRHVSSPSRANAVRFLRDYADYCRVARHIILPIKANRFLAFQTCCLVLVTHAGCCFTVFVLRF